MENLVNVTADQLVLQNTYAGKKVFITGHTGFKGSWLLAWLHQLGAELKGYALPPVSDTDLYYRIGGDSLCQSVFADIRDRERLEKELLEFCPDFIFHLAAQPLVRYSYTRPDYTFEVNFNGTLHLLEAVRKLDKRCSLIVVTTDKVYHNREQQYAYNETDKLGGHDPYSASKAAAEILVASYRSSFFNGTAGDENRKAIAVARAGNVIGGGDWSADRIIPDVVRALSQGLPVRVRNPLSVRPWQHVLEPVNAYLLLGAALVANPVACSGEWNIGPASSDALPVQQVVETAIAVWGSGEYELPVGSPDLHEATLLQLDITKIVSELGWKPKWTATEAIKKTIDWYKNLDDNNALALVNNQIAEYESAR